MKEVTFLVCLAAAVAMVGNTDKDSWRFAFLDFTFRMVRG